MDKRGPFRVIGFVVEDKGGAPWYFARQDVTPHYRGAAITGEALHVVVDNETAWNMRGPFVANDWPPGPEVFAR